MILWLRKQQNHLKEGDVLVGKLGKWKCFRNIYNTQHNFDQCFQNPLKNGMQYFEYSRIELKEDCENYNRKYAVNDYSHHWHNY